MALVRIPIDIIWTGATGSPGVNVWHARVEDGVQPLATDLEEVTEALQQFYSAIDELFPGTCRVEFAGEAGGVGPDSGNVYEAPGWVVNGGGGASFLPPANAMYVNWKAATGGRSGRGRTFIGPLDITTTEADGTPTPGDRDVLQAAADALVSASLTDNGWAIGVWSRSDGLLRDVVTAEAPNKFAVLKSRRD